MWMAMPRAPRELKGNLARVLSSGFAKAGPVAGL